MKEIALKLADPAIKACQGFRVPIPTLKNSLILLQIKTGIKYKVLQMNPLGTRKNPSPRWDSNPPSSVIWYGYANHWATGDSMVSKGEMWVFPQLS